MSGNGADHRPWPDRVRYRPKSAGPGREHADAPQAASKINPKRFKPVEAVKGESVFRYGRRRTIPSARVRPAVEALCDPFMAYRREACRARLNTAPTSRIPRHRGVGNLGDHLLDDGWPTSRNLSPPAQQARTAGDDAIVIRPPPGGLGARDSRPGPLAQITSPLMVMPSAAPRRASVTSRPAFLCVAGHRWCGARPKGGRVGCHREIDAATDRGPVASARRFQQAVAEFLRGLRPVNRCQ